jgi:AraC-like DNA-binding protein
MTEQIETMRRLEARGVLKTGFVPLHFIYELDEVLTAAGISRSQPPGLLAWCVADESETRHSEGHDVPARMGRVVVFIEEHLEGPLSLDLLADEADLSKYYFARLFRDEVGQTPWAYVRKARLQKAKTLLKQGASPVTAALEAGFFDQSHLTNVMKDVEGKTPKQYQQERHGKEDRKDLQE